jgi:hypothetical protein
MTYFEDHGLPLVQLKERRRELVVALSGGDTPIAESKISEIASLQLTIAAMEAVIVDLDAEMNSLPITTKQGRFWLVA